MHKGVILLAKAKTKKEAIDKLYTFMARYNENDPNCENPVWDWWVIGGRWSGTFSLAALGKDRVNKFWQEFVEQGLARIGSNPQEHRKKIEKLFRQHFPEFQGECPVTRNTYKETGYEDDIKPLKDVLPIVQEWYNEYKKSADDYRRDLADLKKKAEEEPAQEQEAWLIRMYEKRIQEIEGAPEKAQFSFEANIDRKSVV